ncbi:MAG: adenine-specific methyltransferase EcoRI family protein [Oscillospiraceae bacterium]|nr:adenine-specific methyltransferase EcoRI family protein [Oscillospiraceae bacterium]
MAKNENLHKASKAKNDEFYTQLSDIENELKHYKEYFKGKTVFCNCDDPYESNFFKYFAMNFNILGIKKLIATCYATSPVANTQIALSGWDESEYGIAKEGKAAYKIEISEVPDLNGDGATDLSDVENLIKSKNNILVKLCGDGDFRSEECIELLKEADIVVTNPPFSLFREYVAQLMEYEKKFIIIGNQNAITYKEIFSLLKDNKLWLGYYAGDMSFTVPDYYEARETRFWIDETGQKWRSLGNICWFTNLDTTKRHEELLLWKTFNPEEYPKYDNYDAIEVSKTADIPCDYDGVMGVPITFLYKYNPKQFEMIWTTDRGGDGKIDHLKKMHTRYDAPVVNGKGLYKRILIRKRK